MRLEAWANFRQKTSIWTPCIEDDFHRLSIISFQRPESQATQIGSQPQARPVFDLNQLRLDRLDKGLCIADLVGTPKTFLPLTLSLSVLLCGFYSCRVKLDFCVKIIKGYVTSSRLIRSVVRAAHS